MGTWLMASCEHHRRRVKKWYREASMKFLTGAQSCEVPMRGSRRMRWRKAVQRNTPGWRAERIRWDNPGPDPLVSVPEQRCQSRSSAHQRRGSAYPALTTSTTRGECSSGSSSCRIFTKVNIIFLTREPGRLSTVPSVRYAARNPLY